MLIVGKDINTINNKINVYNMIAKIIVIIMDNVYLISNKENMNVNV